MTAVTAGLKATALAFTAALLVIDPTTLGLWTVVVTSVAGLAAQFLKMRDDAAKEERRHKWEKEALEAARASAVAIAENTALTRATAVQLEDARASVVENVVSVGARADQSYETANNVNEKIATIAANALILDRATEKTSTEAIRRDISDMRGGLKPSNPPV